MPTMDRHERERKHISLKYDIFDSSPQRPLDNYGGALANASVDQLVLPDADADVDADFALPRKRDHTPVSPPHDNDDDEPGSKRHRTDNWPLRETTTGGNETRWYSSPAKPASLSKRNGTPVRPSKFLEGSMHDRPSDTPPSIFVRNFSMQIANASIDDLMEDYSAELATKPLPPRPRSRSPLKQSHANGIPHHASRSVSSVAPTLDEQKQPGGIFRFGKSMASAFNPLNVWHKVSNSWRETKEELVQEAKGKKEMEERQAKAEEAYAALKLSGQLGMQGSRPLSETAKVFAPGYSLDSTQRDSGIAMEYNSSRGSVDTVSRSSFLAPPSIGASSRQSSVSFDSAAFGDLKMSEPRTNGISPRKSFLHLRTPSFHDLKKIPSVVNLHKRSVSASRSRSPEKDGPPGLNELRRSVSKKDLQKQQKLTRRVSDLQAKLDAARKDLESTLKDTPAGDSADSTPKAVPRPRTSHAPTWKRAFTPALPTLLSERLLGGDDAAERKRNSLEEDEMFSAAMAQTQERPKTRSFSGDSFYLQPNEPFSPAFEAAAKNGSNGVGEATEKMELVELPLLPPPKESVVTVERPHRLPALPSEAVIAEPEEPATVKRVPAKKSPLKKKRASIEDQEFRPIHHSTESESDWKPQSKAKSSPKSRKRAGVADGECSPDRTAAEAEIEPHAKPNTLKKRRTGEMVASPNGSPIQKRTTRASAAANVAAKKTNVLKKPQPVSKIAPTVSEDGLETVLEETTTSTVPLKDAPAKATAFATPAHPSRNHIRSRSRSRSPVKSPQKAGSASANGLPYTNRDARSMSPAPSSVQSKRGRSSPDNPVSIRPGAGEVPPLPTFGGETRQTVRAEDFEWPDDVF